MRKPVPLYVVALLSLFASEKTEAAAPAHFLTFGVGETTLPIDGFSTSPAVPLQPPFKYFGRTFNQVFVNNNGGITFTERFSSFRPTKFPGRDIIAPLWTEFDNRSGGTTSYRQDKSSVVLAQVTAAINQYFPNIPFAATSAFVATFDHLAYYRQPGVVATVQVVLVSGGHRSFILFNYGDIAEGPAWLAGYYTVDNVNSFTLPVASVQELTSGSNVNVTGRWCYNVDGSKLPAHFLTFGNGEESNPSSDDGSSDAIALLQPFKYFGRTRDQIFVNNNGHLTFARPLSDYTPLLNSGRDIIAPLWTQLDNRRGGTISYRQETSSDVLAQVTAAVNRYFPYVPFGATSAFVATFDNVPYNVGEGVVTFQVVLVSFYRRSFILFNYGDISAGPAWLAGYNTVDNTKAFRLPVASVQELSSSSNINVTGSWCFQVDGSPNLPAHFLSFGNGEKLNPLSDDGSSDAIVLLQPFKYFGRTHNHIFVNNNGHLTFIEPLSAFTPLLNSGRDIIAPLWTQLDHRRAGIISYRQDTRSEVLAQVTAVVNKNFPNIPFAATSAFVATFDSVPYNVGEGVATVQVVLVSSGHRSFILFNYGNISAGPAWLAGYNTVDNANSFRLPVANVQELSSSSNINVTGRWCFQVDGSPNLPAHFLSFGNGEKLTPRLNNGSSDAIVLLQPFKYFGRTHKQIFVNNNGHLTFTEPLSAYTPLLNSGRDIIAPLWTQLDHRRGGTISYRQETRSEVLAQVTAVVNKNFPSIPFGATSAFVATFDSVPYNVTEGVATFQVVLVSGGHRSFILFNYGNISAGPAWMAGYNTVDNAKAFRLPVASVQELSSSSNINGTGRWCFQVDGSPNLPAHFLSFGNGEKLTPLLDNGSSDAIVLLQPFKYFGRTHNQIFVNNNGHLTFTEPLSDYTPLLNSGRDIIAPLWTQLDHRRGGTVSYRQETRSYVLAQVTAAVNKNFPDLPLPFNTTSAFVATWDSVPYSSGEGAVTFQVVLVSNLAHSFALFNYGNITESRQHWQALYDTMDSEHSSSISLLNASELSSNSNVNLTGQWVFHVYDVCGTLGCTSNEICSFNTGYGCACKKGQRPNPETFDAMQVCGSGSANVSLSRCQLFEFDIPPENLHLNDPNCTATSENGRILFQFGKDDHNCGTNITSNDTHFIYQNSIHSDLPESAISRSKWVKIPFSCANPLIQTLSMPMEIKAVQSSIILNLHGQGTNQISMIPYQDAQFTRPFEGNNGVKVNQKMYVAVKVEGLDRSQIATTLENCWATPVNDSKYQIRWNLIVDECPNPEDKTVEILQNGVDTASRFSFRMFIFTGLSDRIFLHCQVHLCLVQSGRCAQTCIPGLKRRRRRFLDYYHSVAISMGL